MPKKETLNAKDIAKIIAGNLSSGDDGLSIVERIQKHGIRTEDNRPFDFKYRKFLIDYYNDLTPQQATRASAQVGKTVGLYVKGLFLAMDGMNVAFSEPTQDLRDMLTKTKLNRIVENNEYFSNVVSGGMDIKYVKKNIMYLIYTYGAAGGIGWSSDLNILDEVSRSNPEMIDRLKSRLLNSPFKWEWFVSNPNVSEDLLDRKWKASDQKHWAIQCNHCGKRQILNYDGLHGYKGNVCKERKIFVCQYCDLELSVESRIDGEWVKRFKDRDFISGYWIHQLQRYDCDIQELLYEEKKNMHTFKNMYLGEPYNGSDVTVDASTIKANLVSKIKPNSGIVAGIDVGNATGHHMTFMHDNKVFALHKAADFEEIEELLIKYNVEQAVIDYMPEYEGAKKLQSHFPNMVLRCRYLPNKSSKDAIINVDEQTGIVHVLKHIMFDNIIVGLARGDYKFAFNGNDKSLDEFCAHFSTLSKIPEIDGAGNPTYKWVAPDGSHDHYAHSFLYACVAQERLNSLKPVHGIYVPNEFEKSKSSQSFEPEFEDMRKNDWETL